MISLNWIKSLTDLVRWKKAYTRTAFETARSAYGPFTKHPKRIQKFKLCLLEQIR